MLWRRDGLISTVGDFDNYNFPFDKAKVHLSFNPWFSSPNHQLLKLKEIKNLINKDNTWSILKIDTVVKNIEWTIGGSTLLYSTI